MYKLLLALGVLDLAFSYPLFTALTLVGVFFYDRLTEQDKQQLMSIYSSGKEFTKYLSNKANELKISLKELRKQIVTDLEIPEAVPVYKGSLKDDSFDSELESMLSEYISIEDINKAKENVILVEQLAKTIKESLEVPESIWIESTLEMFLQKDDFDGEFREVFVKYLPNIKLTNIFTPKDYRQLQAKVKSLYRNALGEVIDTNLQITCDSLLKITKAYFTDNYNYEI